MTPATVTTPFSGSQVGSITYGDNSSPFVGMFGQNINLVAGTTYNLSAVSALTRFYAANPI
jgi:hypothetical protein